MRERTSHSLRVETGPETRQESELQQCSFLHGMKGLTALSYFQNVDASNAWGECKLYS